MRKKVSIKDTAIIKKRLAKGKSLRQAIKGTGVKSPMTAKRIAEDEVDDIGQIRKKYLQLIESFESYEIDRAKLWAGMTQATKLFGKDAVEHPDWRSRAEALRYIDSLAGVAPEEKGGATINIFNNPEFIKQYDER